MYQFAPNFPPNVAHFFMNHEDSLVMDSSLCAGNENIYSLCWVSSLQIWFSLYTSGQTAHCCELVCYDYIKLNILHRSTLHVRIEIQI